MKDRWILLRLPTLEDHPWAEISYIYATELAKSNLPIRAVSYTGAPNLMITTSKWYELARLFEIKYEYDPYIQLVFGPGEQLERLWTRAPVTIALTAGQPVFKENHARAAKDYDHILTISKKHAEIVAQSGIQSKVIKPEELSNFIGKLLL